MMAKGGNSPQKESCLLKKEHQSSLPTDNCPAGGSGLTGEAYTGNHLHPIHVPDIIFSC